jgi:GAF domain-containing protein
MMQLQQESRSISSVLNNPARLETLRRYALLDTPTEESFDRLTRLASKIADAPVSLISLLDADRQFVKSFVGVGDPISVTQELDLSYSLCKHMLVDHKPLVLEDARLNAIVSSNLAVTEMGAVGYLGMPLLASNGQNIGSFCVIDTKPRQWTDRQIDIMRELAVSVMTEMELRSENALRKQAEEKVNAAYIALEKRNNELRRLTEFCSSTIDQTISVVRMDGAKAELLDTLRSAQQVLEQRAF